MCFIITPGKFTTPVLLSILYLGWTLSVLVIAAENSSTDKPSNTNLDVEAGTYEFNDTNDPLGTKRSGNKQAIGKLLSSLFSKKLSLLGPLSSLSSSSSNSGKRAESSVEPSAPQPKPLDWKELKMNIKASLLQAIKAITGGVIAINGQLVKVKGHLLALTGHLISGKGDKISDFGKNLATNAFSTATPSESRSDESGSTTTANVTGGPAVAQSFFEWSGFPNHHFRQSIEHTVDNFKRVSGYAKRETPYYTPEDDDVVS